MVKKQQQKGGQEITLSEDIVPEWPKKGLKYQLSRSFLRRCANMTADDILFPPLVERVLLSEDYSTNFRFNAATRLAIIILNIAGGAGCLLRRFFL